MYECMHFNNNVDHCINEFVSKTGKKYCNSYMHCFRDKALAVTYPLKSSIWLTQKRVYYICYLTIIILTLVNLYFIELADILEGNNDQKYCGLLKDSLLIDITTASILPIGRLCHLY